MPSLPPSWKELYSSSLNQNNAERISKFLVRETSFLTESVDIVPDESSCVKKDDPRCIIGSQLSTLSESLHNKPDEGTLYSQDVVRCSSLSLIDPLCSVVPCSISSEHANSETHIDKENSSENFVPFISELVDNFQRISDKDVTFDCRDQQIMPVLDGKDVPTAIEVVEQLPEKLNRVEHTCQKQLNSLQTYSMLLPNQALNLNCNLTPLPTNQSMSGAASLGTRVSESPFASKHADEKINKENHGCFVDHKSIIQIIDDKSADELKLNAVDASCILAEPAQERKSPLILNHRTCRRLLGPRTVVNDISVEEHMKYHVVPETGLDQQNNNLNKLQVEFNELHGGCVSVRKEVRFSEKVEEHHQKRQFSKLESSYNRCKPLVLVV